MNTDNVNIQAGILTGVFNECLDECAPIVTKEIMRPPASWITQEIKMVMSNRDRLRSIRDKNYSAMAIENYRRSKGKVKLMIKNAKVNYFQKKFKECKNIWNITDEIVPSKKKNKQVCSFNDAETTAENFNNYFSNVGRNFFLETQQSREIAPRPVHVNPPPPPSPSSPSSPSSPPRRQICSNPLRIGKTYSRSCLSTTSPKFKCRQ